LTFGDRAESTQNDCGCLHTRTGGGRTCRAFATMPIGETGWQTTSGSKSAAWLRISTGLGPTAGKHRPHREKKGSGALTRHKQR